MLRRYLKAQATVLLFGGLVGPIFLIVYFALGTMARPYLQWMFWAGLFVTAADVLAALALASAGSKSEARHEELTKYGILVLARITGMSDTSWFVNDQQMIKVNLHIEVPGLPGFDAQETMASSPTRMQILGGRKLVALVEPGTQKYEIDWNASTDRRCSASGVHSGRGPQDLRPHGSGGSAHGNTDGSARQPHTRQWQYRHTFQSCCAPANHGHSAAVGVR